MADATRRPGTPSATLGPTALSSADLLERDRAARMSGRSRVLAQHGSLDDLARADVAELTHDARRRRGARRPARWRRSRSAAGPSAPSADADAGRSARRATSPIGCCPRWRRLEREELRVLLLNAKNAVLRVSHRLPGQRVGGRWCALPSCSATRFEPRRRHVIVHNHPIGRPRAVGRRPAPHRRGDRGRASARHRAARPRDPGRQTHMSACATAESRSTAANRRANRRRSPAPSAAIRRTTGSVYTAHSSSRAHIAA